MVIIVATTDVLKLNYRNDKGLALNRIGKFNEAIECYDNAIKIDPNFAVAWKNKGLALNRIGTVPYNLGKFNEAIECYDNAIKIDPNFAVAWKNKDDTLRKLEQFKAQSSALYNSGFSLHNSGKYNEAIMYYDKALEIDPKYVHAWYNKGLTLNILGKYKEAIQCYDKAFEIDPKYGLAMKNRDIALKHYVGKKSRWKRIFR